MTAFAAREIPAVLLAAGGSTRMGRTKQLLPYRGRTLVWHAASELISAEVSPVILVTGHDSAAVAAAVSDLPLSICHHAAWQDGIGSTLRAGVRHAIERAPAAPAVLIGLADQPGVTADHLRALLAAAGTGRIAASGYTDSPGVPAVFPRAFFDALLAIPNTAGAKSVIAAFAAATIAIPLRRPEDIDYPADFTALLARDAPRPERSSQRHSRRPATGPGVSTCHP